MIQFMIAHLNDILIALSSIVTGASALSALTPTKKDDAFWGFIKKILDIFALNIANAKRA